MNKDKKESRATIKTFQFRKSEWPTKDFQVGKEIGRLLMSKHPSSFDLEILILFYLLRRAEEIGLAIDYQKSSNKRNRRRRNEIDIYQNHDSSSFLLDSELGEILSQAFNWRRTCFRYNFLFSISSSLTNSLMLLLLINLFVQDPNRLLATFSSRIETSLGYSENRWNLGELEQKKALLFSLYQTLRAFGELLETFHNRKLFVPQEFFSFSFSLLLPFFSFTTFGIFVLEKQLYRVIVFQNIKLSLGIFGNPKDTLYNSSEN
jgi:hypothetical protein